MTVIEPNLLEKQRQDKATQELMVWCNGQFKSARQMRIPYERQWYLNLSFYFGKHYVQWQGANTGTVLSDPEFAKLYEPAAPPWRVRLVTNKVRSMVRGELSKVVKEKPRGFVIPATTDDADVAAARAGDSIYEHLQRELQMTRVIRRAMFWTALCGTGFVKDWYDAQKIDAGGVKGSILAEPVSAFHILVPDVQEEELESQPWVLHALAKSPEWVRTTFGVNVPPDSPATGGLLESRFLSAIGVNQSMQKREYVAVKEMWVKPSDKFKQGAIITWAGDTLLNLTETWPYQHREFPFTKFDHIPTGRFYAESTLVDLIPLQREFNRTRSQLIEAKNRMSKPQLVAARGSVNPNKITSEPGLVIEYTPGFQPPSPLPLQNIPGYVIEEYNRIQRDMDDISSQHEITRGGVPPGVTAATAISYLQEQDDSKLAPTVSSLEEGVEKIGRHFLNHVQQFWNVQRKIRVIGDNGQFESFVFSRSNIKGNTDFRVEAGSATPTSRAAKQAFILELVKMEILPPDKALRYLNMAETGRLYEEMQLDARQAQRENLKILLAPPEIEQIPVNDWDNHDVHLIEHDNFCKTQQFEATDETIKIRMLMHRKSHQQIKAQGMGQVMRPDDPQLSAIASQAPSPEGNGNAVAAQGSGPIQ
jgi:hypothetical protein